jgi:peroxiredoxin
MRKGDLLVAGLLLGLSAQVGLLTWRNHVLGDELLAQDEVLQRMREQLSSVAGAPEIGRVAPSFRLSSATGDTLALGTGPQFLVFFSTTCPACEMDAPSWGELYREYGAEEIDFVGVCVRSGAISAESFASTWELGFPVVATAGAEVADAYAADYLPKRVLIDAAGRIIWADGPSSPLGEEGEARIREVLAQLVS